MQTFTQIDIDNWKYSGKHIKAAHITREPNGNYSTLIHGDFALYDSCQTFDTLNGAQEYVLFCEDTKLAPLRLQRKWAKEIKERMEESYFSEIDIPVRITRMNGLLAFSVKGQVDAIHFHSEVNSCGSFRTSIIDEVAGRLLSKIKKNF